MSDFTIELLVDEEPEDAEALIKELLYLYKKNKDKAESLEKELSRVKQKHEKASKHIEEVKKNDKVA
jgi:vacuolar-type H+-ATPase subunit I/STV1